MKSLFCATTMLALLTACQPSDQKSEDAAEQTEPAVTPNDEAAESFQTTFVGKYALEGDCDEGKPVLEFTSDKVSWGETSCSISGASLNDEGLVEIRATQCIAEGEAQGDRSYTLEAGGMMGIEITSEGSTSSVKRCEAFED